MSSLSKTTIIGNLTQDGEQRTMNNGKPVVTLNVATNESWKDKNGEWQEKAEYHRVVIFNEFLAEKAAKLRKGNKVYIEGQNQTRSYEKDGDRRYVTEIVLQSFRGAVIPLDKVESYQSAGGESDNFQNDSFGGGGLDDEIPFISKYSQW